MRKTGVTEFCQYVYSERQYWRRQGHAARCGNPAEVRPNGWVLCTIHAAMIGDHDKTDAAVVRRLRRKLDPPKKRFRYDSDGRAL